MYARAIHKLFLQAGVTALVVAMLLSPSLGQIAAAECCRLACMESSDSPPACCSLHKVMKSGDRADSPAHGHDGKGADSGDPYCPGCGGRPLFVTPNISLVSFESDPLYIPAPVSTPTSADVPFTIFHPPRA